MKTCPWCRKQFPNAASAVEPKNEDVSLCPRCGELSLFNSEIVGGLRKPDGDETRRLKANPELNMLRDRWRRLHS